MTDHSPTLNTDTNPRTDGMASVLRESPAAHGVLLALFCLATALILSLVDIVTRGPIADRGREDLYASLAQVVPDEIHDNAMTDGAMTVTDAEAGAVTVYVARRAGTPTGVAFEMTGQGYGGAIRVLLGIDPNGELLGVRVLAHAETPGLGDKIEEAKSDWIHGFAGLSLSNPGPEGWKVKRDGGQFDQFSGATITPRAVVDAIHRGLEFYARNRDTLLSAEETGSQ
ncbi:electron transport complex subunit RsxG [Tropicimonas marinistellae]|uniref:electron transport complex subunit RsxG n=1 Tax=Tropicimonas marinistellae TaxID=1739787 RepID=UPI000AFCCA8B|nr:electron transport complex subunit RsxG [Tropicimonas marinistellae]